MLYKKFREIPGETIKICSQDGEFGQASLSDIEEHILVYEKSQINFCEMCTRSHQKACQ